MAKFVISGDTETGELSATLDGMAVANVSYISTCMYETYEGEKKCAVNMESREKVGDATKVTILYASKDSKKELLKAQLADAVMLDSVTVDVQLPKQSEIADQLKKNIGNSLLDQMNLHFKSK